MSIFLEEEETGMPRGKTTVYFCQNCGYESGKLWL